MKHTVNIIAMGDVGITLATGLILTGGADIAEIGIYDKNPNSLLRAENELSRIYADGLILPEIKIVGEDELFDCSVLIFCASAGVPEIGSAIDDVRMAQLEKNASILSIYAKRARGFGGLFAIVSDPVDLLCACAYYHANHDESGAYTGGLSPHSIRGYGLGVMHARAMACAKSDPRFSSYIDEGRAYGPHGKSLVIANSIKRYDDELSLALTAEVVNANKKVRSLGFKPFIAPALSSGALSILATLRGEWHYSAVYDGGIYFGMRNRLTQAGTELESVELPEKLRQRIERCRANLKEEGARWSFNY